MASEFDVLGTARVRIEPDTTGFEPALRKEIAKAGQSLSSGLQTLGAGLSAGGRVLTAGLTLPILGLGAAAIKASIDFESAFAGVRKTVDATEPEFAALSEGFRTMTRQIPASAVELARIGEVAGQLGIRAEDILAFTRVVADLGETTDLVGEQAATALARIANIMGTSVENFDNLGAAIVALGNAGASTESEIVDMALRIAGAGTTIGLTEGEVLGFANALASVGINAEAGGSAISRVFIEVAKSVTQGGDELTRFAEIAGLSSAEFQKAFKEDAAGAIVTFVEGLGKIQAAGGDVFTVLEDLKLDDIRVRDALLRAASAGDLFRESIALGSEALKEGSALAVEAGKRYATTAAQLEIARNKFTDILITLGDALKPVLLNLLEAITPILAAFAKAVEIFAKLPAPIQVAVVAFLAFLAVVGPVLIIAGSLISAIGAIAGAVTFLAPVLFVLVPAFASLLAPIAAVIAILVAIGVVAVLVVKHWDTIKNAFVTAITFVVDFVKRNWPLILAIISGPIGLVVLLIVRSWDTIRNATSAAFGAVKSIVLGALGSLAGAATNAWNAVVGAFQSAYNRIAGIVSSIKRTFCNLPFVPCSPIPLVEDAKAAVLGIERAFRALQIPSLHAGIGFDSPALPNFGTRQPAFAPRSGVTQNVTVNQVANDPNATAQAVMSRLALQSQR